MNGVDGPRNGEYYVIVWHRSWRSKTVVPVKVKTVLRYRSENFCLVRTVHEHECAIVIYRRVWYGGAWAYNTR